MMKRILALMLCLILSVFLFWGCSKGEDDDTGETQKLSETEEIVDTKEPETEEVSGEDEVAASLMSIRQAMVGTPAMLGVAYIGGTDSMESVDTINWAKERLPEFCSNLPFICEIEDDHIIGERYGELYLIVPCDENASVAINHVDGSGEVTEVIYRSDNGDPVLVFANNTGFPSDTQINIVDNEGKTLTYYPTLNDLYYVTQYSDMSVYDFTSYAEILSREYADFQNYSWKIPEKLDIIDTAWDTCYYLADGTTSEYHITISSNEIHIQYNGNTFNAPWDMVTEDGICKLKLDPDTDDERSICLLLSTEHDYIYLSQDFVKGAARCDEPLSVIMDRTFG